MGQTDEPQKIEIGQRWARKDDGGVYNVVQICPRKCATSRSYGDVEHVHVHVHFTGDNGRYTVDFLGDVSTTWLRNNCVLQVLPVTRALKHVVHIAVSPTSSTVAVLRETLDEKGARINAEMKTTRADVRGHHAREKISDAVAGCRLGCSCSQHKPAKAEPWVPSVDEWDLLEDA